MSFEPSIYRLSSQGSRSARLTGRTVPACWCTSPRKRADWKRGRRRTPCSWRLRAYVRCGRTCVGRSAYQPTLFCRTIWREDMQTRQRITCLVSRQDLAPLSVLAYPKGAYAQGERSNDGTSDGIGELLCSASRWLRATVRYRWLSKCCCWMPLWS